MQRLTRFLGGLWALLSRSRVGRDLDDELRQYLDDTTEAHIAAGMSPGEARRAARLQVGNLEAAKDRVRDVGWERMAESVWQDVRYAFRMMRKAPGFTVAVVLTLGLGIGGTTAVFSVVDALFLRAPGGVADAASVRRVFVRRDQGDMRTPDGTAGMWFDARDVRDGSRAFGGIAAYKMPQVASLGQGASATSARVSVVSGEFLAVLGVRPALGRLLLPADDGAPGSSSVVVIGHGIWLDRFGGTEDVLGRTLLINNYPLQIVGVTERGFTGIDADPADVWLSAAMAAHAGLESDENWRTALTMSSTTRHIARLRSTTDADRAATEASAAIAHATDPDSGLDPTPEVVLPALTLAVLPGSAWAVDLSLWLLIAAGLVLVISCANVVNLIVARGVARRRELAMRLSLGAGGWRIARQQLTESAVLAALGGIAGAAMASAGMALLGQLSLPTPAGGLDVRLFTFAMALGLLTAGAFGVLPALRAVRIDPVSVLKNTQASGSSGGHRIRFMLVAVQVSLSFALLVGAALFVRSLGQISAIQGGADLDRLLTVDVNLSGEDADDSSRPYERFFARARARLDAMPGVERAAVVGTAPFEWARSVFWRMRGDDEYQRGYLNVAGPGYFETAGTSLLRGRGVLASDTSGTQVIGVVNEAMARQLAADGEVLGLCVPFVIRSRDGGCYRIVGVVASQRHDYLDPEAVPMVYIADAQAPPALSRDSWMLLVRTDGDAADHRVAVQSALQGLRSDLPHVRVAPLAERLQGQLRPFRLGAMLFTLFGVLALVLSGVGLHGVLGYVVAERAAEVGIRRALGSPGPAVMRLVLRQALVPVSIGLAIGLGLALVAGQVLASRLFGIGPHDVQSFAGAAVFLAVVAAVATVTPVWRAVRIDPMIALRQD
jgi:predicted permease